MDYIKLYRRFVYSHYFAEGLRISMGVLLPALVAGYYGFLQKGIYISLGALCASLTDNPGPIHHRRNGLLLTCGVIAVVGLIVGFSLQIPWLFLIVLPILCFIFSMIAIYGARVTSIGIAALLVLVMLTHQALSVNEVALFCLLLLCGGLWYTGLSLTLNRLRPYKLIQQVLGEYVLSAGDYLAGRASFYEKGVSTETAYRQLMHLQIEVQHKQDLVAELLFKTRGFVKESSVRSRVLMMSYLDVTELMERAMTSHFDYEKLHQFFDETEILEDYQLLIKGLANELENIGIALISDQPSTFSEEMEVKLTAERDRLQALRLRLLKPSNLEGFISLRHILDSIGDIATRIRTLHRYTKYDKELADRKVATNPGDAFIAQTDYSWQLFADNLSWKSNIFRHSVRVTLAAMVAYTVGLFWNLGHSYWILLTVIIILKPGYGLTRTRNKERIIGTLIGTMIAGVILYLVTNNRVVLVLLTIFMIGGYSFLRWKYLVSVIFITAYLMLMFHLLEPNSFITVVSDRIIDTFIGGGIAFIASMAIPSVWERVQIGSLLKELMEKAKVYYRASALVFTGLPPDKSQSGKFRKDTWVALANLSDAFNRMLSEPKTKQRNSQEWHRLVVSSHMLVSHTATLTSYAERITPEFVSPDYAGIIKSTEHNFDRIILSATHATAGGLPEESLSEEDPLSAKLQALISNRHQELTRGHLDAAHREYLSTFKTITDQFYFIRNATVDVVKILDYLYTTNNTI